MSMISVLTLSIALATQGPPAEPGSGAAGAAAQAADASARQRTPRIVEFRDKGLALKELADDGTTFGALRTETGLVRAVSVNCGVYRQDPFAGLQLLDHEREKLNLGDRLQLLVNANQNLSVYVFWENEVGRRAVLVPRQGEPPARVKAGENVYIPGRGETIEVVEPLEKVKLLVFVTLEPVEGLLPDEAFGEFMPPEVQERQDRVLDRAGPILRLQFKQKGERILDDRADPPTYVGGVKDQADESDPPAPQSADDGAGRAGDDERPERKSPALFLEFELDTVAAADAATDAG